MSDATNFPQLFGAVFPAESQVIAGVEYGPTGDEFEGTVNNSIPQPSSILHIRKANAAFRRLLTVRAESVTITRGSVTSASRAIRAKTDYTEPSDEGFETIVRRDDWLFDRNEYIIGGTAAMPAAGDVIISGTGLRFVVVEDHQSENTEPIHPELLQLRVRTKKVPNT